MTIQFCKSTNSFVRIWKIENIHSGCRVIVVFISLHKKGVKFQLQFNFEQLSDFSK